MDARACVRVPWKMEMKEKNLAQAKENRLRESGMDRAYNILVYILLTLALIVTIYPMIIVLSSSFSSSAAVLGGKVWLYPIGFNLMGYEAVFRNARIWIGYKNSIWYTAVGTLVNVIVTIMAAYPLSRKDFRPRRFVMLLFTFTMFFSGGMIPAYILVSNLHLMNTRWALILPTALSVYNMILMRTYFQSNFPDELLEAAQLDGCSDLYYLWRVVLPLSKPIIAVIALYYAVGHWNEYFNAFMYLSDPQLQPLQIVLRSILIQNSVDSLTIDLSNMVEREALKNLLKYSLIVVASVPVLVIYPFVQKFFVKGVMIGSVKG